MAKNILITPNRTDPSLNPRIDFVGASTGYIHLEVLENGTVAFMGNNGGLFSIVDDASGSLMSVNNISGLPILEVWSTDKVDINGLLKVDGSITTNGVTLIYPPINASDAVTKGYADFLSSKIQHIINTSSYTITETSGEVQNFVTYANGSCNIYLPEASGNTSRVYVKKDNSSNYSVYINPFQFNTIEYDTLGLIEFENTVISLVAKGTNWFVM